MSQQEEAFSLGCWTKRTKKNASVYDVRTIVVQWLALPPHSKKGSISVLTVSEFSSFVSQSKNMRIRLRCDSKFSVGVHVKACVSLYVSPAMKW